MNRKVSSTEWATAHRKLAAAKKAMEQLEKIQYKEESDHTMLTITNVISVCETLMRAME